MTIRRLIELAKIGVASEVVRIGQLTANEQSVNEYIEIQKEYDYLQHSIIPDTEWLLDYDVRSLSLPCTAG